MSPQLSSSNKFFTFVTATLLSIGLLCSSPAALAKDKFRVAWSIYVGWMPWDYGAQAGIVESDAILAVNPSLADGTARVRVTTVSSRQLAAIVSSMLFTDEELAAIAAQPPPAPS